MLGKNLNEKSNYNYVKIKSIVLYYYRNILAQKVLKPAQKKKKKVKLIVQKV